jgi:hypothetical protein
MGQALNMEATAMTIDQSDDNSTFENIKFIQKLGSQLTIFEIRGSYKARLSRELFYSCIYA